MINLENPTQTHKHMSSALNIENNASSPVRKRTLSQKVEVGVTSLVFVTITLVAIVSLAYLAHSNRNATKGYALKTLEAKRTSLVTENEVWDMQIAKVKSLDALANDPKIAGMIAAEQPMFIRGDTAVAVK
jgi:hypothetical protein